MDTKFDFGAVEGERIVYVRPVAVADLPDELRAHAGNREVIWAVHGADGEQLALVADRRMAFLLARENDYAPLSVH
ncbi:DUF1150 family protein [Frigidibacter sp. SD6-1]|uniref:DUF1150 family protein n=1 Tax=Frigidibacter sp. SD6-1 TaxID=3032581 RepID=UPI0024DF31CC|nr:DUF1150 family protein [Frigidibacter sp. SD6-1]